MSIVAIVNPEAGAGTCRKRWLRFLRYLSRSGSNFEIVTLWTEGPGHAVELASEAVSKQTKRIIAVGGDGTVHEVINGILRSTEPTRPETSLFIMPFGRGNDYAEMLGIPHDFEELVALLQNQHEVILDAGVIECHDISGERKVHYFNNIVGLGFDASVAHRTQRADRKIPFSFVYLYSILRELSHLQTYSLDVQFDHQSLTIQTFLFVIAIGRCFGGGLKIAPFADPRDGLFDVIWAESISRMEILRLLPRVYRGQHLDHPAVHSIRCASLTITSNRPAPIEAEGEIIGYSPLAISIQPRRLRVMTPVKSF